MLGKKKWGNGIGLIFFFPRLVDGFIPSSGFQCNFSPPLQERTCKNRGKKKDKRDDAGLIILYPDW